MALAHRKMGQKRNPEIVPNNQNLVAFQNKRETDTGTARGFRKK